MKQTPEEAHVMGESSGRAIKILSHAAMVKLHLIGMTETKTSSTGTHFFIPCAILSSTKGAIFLRPVNATIHKIKVNLSFTVEMERI